ncbi:MAG: hypothetical protein II875_06375 [Clostridia bacterium]|nr:hypothetical protein [Clostridia bacterium]
MKRVTLFAGHYGSGKTNLAVNYALKLAGSGLKTLIADLDIVNPYFRTRDSQTELDEAGIRIIVSPYANSNVDVPALPDEMYAVTDDKSYHCVIDVGGDDRGALALGRLSPALREENDFDMLFVVNFYRPLTRDWESALTVMREIELASGMRFTGIVNNSNLGQLTKAEDVAATDVRARELAAQSGLKLLTTTVKEELAAKTPDSIENITPIRLHFRGDWVIY